MNDRPMFTEFIPSFHFVESEEYMSLSESEQAKILLSKFKSWPALWADIEQHTGGFLPLVSMIAAELDGSAVMIAYEFDSWYQRVIGGSPWRVKEIK